MASVGPTRPEPGETGSLTGSSEKLSSSAVNRMLMEFLMYFGRAVFLFYPVYLTGYLGLSISWVLLCMMMITWYQKNRQWKDARIGSAIQFVDNETDTINEELKGALQMASWVHFTDVEKANWLNKVLEQAWPFFGMYMEKLLKENIQPVVRQSNGALKMFNFTKVHFGHIPPKITGIKAFTHEVDHREVILDMNISYEGDVDIDAEVKPPITAGVKGLKLQGMIRVILEPLIGQAPLVGGVTFFFIRRPTLQINWTGMTNLLDSPAFSSLSEDAIMDIIASLMVLPNRMCIPLIDQVKVDQMRFPLPRGVVRVHLLEARDLVAKDTYMMGMVKGKSDPYATLRVGNRSVKSKTIKENLHPKWGEVYEFVVHEAPGQELEVELFDEDTDKDDFIGRFNLDFGEVKREKEMDQWFPLEGVPYGEIHLKLQWLSLQSDSSLLTETTDGLSCAMLAVYLDGASNLPKDHSEIDDSHHRHGKHSKEARLTRRVANPNSYVEFSVDEDVQKSLVKYASKDPVWEEGFTFFIRNARTQQLKVQVKEHEKKTQLGVLNIPLTRLLETSDMTLDQRFPLDRSGASSHIKMKVTLRILTVEEPPPKIILTPPPPKAQDGVQNASGGNSGFSSRTVASTSSVPAASSPLRAAYSQNGLNESYPAHRRGSFLASETSKSPPSASHMRRFDSHSLLSENSMASSRFDLLEGASYPAALRNHQGSLGEIELSVRYATLRKKLIVLVNSCRNIFPCSENGTDSYVRMYLLPNQSWIHRKRTHVKKKTVNPVFNDKFEYDVTLEEAQTRMLDVSVKNNRLFHRRERKDIGMVLIDLSQLDLVKGVTQWYELTLPGLKKSV
ncbi:extended synaptotagmin-3-like [Salarias fasciatus]|uniref:Extended synaptotagmin-3 n=1 Tax=Salarias fasciatus TaxID=181472 RepID=A0A672IEG8_SALFA|nr:extended synaptotagmin-3-like [Salarias fasciatus]XP_029968566.1 extended synaptotagmin-3-like [Salarias fasciatus]